MMKNVLFLTLLVFAFSGYLIAAEPELSEHAVKAPERLLMDIQAVGDNRLVTVGERGHILVSDDQGDSWKQIVVPTNALLTRLVFIDETTGWAVGHQQVILKTEDAGDTWQLQYQNENLDQPALFDVWFKNRLDGIAIGAYGLFLKTSDGGKNWEEVYQESLEDYEIGFPHFYSLSFDQNNGLLYLAGELGLLAQSSDYGETWTKLESPYQGSFFNIKVLPNGYALVAGLRGHLFRTTDNGNSWTQIKTNTTSVLQKIVLLPNNKLVIVGADGTLLLSDDFAKNVTLKQRGDRVHLASAVALANLDVLLVGVNGILKADLN